MYVQFSARIFLKCFKELSGEQIEDVLLQCNLAEDKLFARRQSRRDLANGRVRYSFQSHVELILPIRHALRVNLTRCETQLIRRNYVRLALSLSSQLIDRRPPCYQIGPTDFVVQRTVPGRLKCKHSWQQ